MNKKLLKQFNGIRKRLAAIPDIHRGGCAIAAYAMHVWLKKHMPETQSTVVYGHGNLCADALNNKQSVLSDDPTSAVNCSHAWIKMQVDGETLNIDCKRDVYTEFYAFKIEMPEEHVKQSINRGLWSPHFNRLQCAKIEAVSGVHLSFAMIEPIRSLQFTNPFLDFSSTRLGF